MLVRMDTSIAWSMAHAIDFRTGRHVVYALTVHLVFLPKYRKKLISERAFVVLRTAWETVCKDFECEIRESGYEADHFN